MCGGTRAVGEKAFAELGLSPRVRGNQIGLQRLELHERSIPACAGEPQPQPRPGA